jgi:stearoyl-CoA 9-desaturase NADPH oxidoreductase
MVRTLRGPASQTRWVTTFAGAVRPPSALRDRLVRLASLVTTPLVPADYLDVLDPLASGADLRGRIVEVRPETHDAVTLVIQVGRGWRGHTPGQYIRLGVDIDGVRQWRAYSVTSPTSRRDGCLTITVKAMPDGTVSNHLVRRARAGTVVQLDQAAGEFVLPGQLPAKALFVTGGSGITPVMGMLRDAVDDLKDVVVVHSAPTAADVIFADELRSLASRGLIQLVVRHTDAEGMLDPAGLAELVPDLAERETWACGPIGLLDAMEQRWSAEGWSELLHTERFRPAVLVTGEGGTVSFTKSRASVEATGSTPILAAGEQAGVLMPFGCRMGICFGCVAPLREGTVRDLRNGDITTAAAGDGVVIQTCINAAAGACEIDL